MQAIRNLTLHKFAKQALKTWPSNHPFALRFVFLRTRVFRFLTQQMRAGRWHLSADIFVVPARFLIQARERQLQIAGAHLHLGIVIYFASIMVANQLVIWMS